MIVLHFQNLILHQAQWIDRDYFTPTADLRILTEDLKKPKWFKDTKHKGKYEYEME